jgi:hypothetical protein
MDDMKERVVALLPKIRETRVAGEATVLQMFDINVKAKQTVRIAGCRVGNGVLEKDKIVRVLRDGDTIFEGTRMGSGSTMMPHAHARCQARLRRSSTSRKMSRRCGRGWSAASAFGASRTSARATHYSSSRSLKSPGTCRACPYTEGDAYPYSSHRHHSLYYSALLEII